jgi:hypothetical protein
MVSIEGKGIDWALEILVSGDRRKDLVKNVEKYARLGISEYFVFDFQRKVLTAYRLPGQGARGGASYQKIQPRLGRFRSQVLDLDLAVVEGELCFFQENAQLLDADELIAQLQGMVDDLSSKAQEEMEALRQELEQERLRGLTQALFAVFAGRGITVPDEVRARILACTDPTLLEQWIPRAAVCATAAEAVSA